VKTMVSNGLLHRTMPMAKACFTFGVGHRWIIDHPP
jgi:hypothetical protein